MADVTTLDEMYWPLAVSAMKKVMARNSVFFMMGVLTGKIT